MTALGCPVRGRRRRAILIRARQLFVLAALGVIAFSVLLSCNPSLPSAGGAPRIVSLTPSVTETLFAVGAGSEVVGVSEYDDYPPHVRKLPKIGSFLTPNVEEIAALRPSLVIGLTSSSDWREIHALKAMGIAILMVHENSVVTLERSIEEIAARVGHQRQGRALVARMRRRMRQTEERLRGTDRRRVLMVVGHQPLVAVGPGTYLDELLKLARAQNIAQVSDQAWPRLSIEYVIAQRPEVILDGQMGTESHARSAFWDKYPSIPAVRNHCVFGYPDDPTLRPGPRIAQTLELLARLIHPAAFASPVRLGHE